jgi:hypothetical protein
MEGVELADIRMLLSFFHLSPTVCGFYSKETLALGRGPEFSQGLHMFIPNDHVFVA